MGVAAGFTGYERLKAEFLEYHAQVLRVHTGLFPEVGERLDALSRSDHRWGIVTNKAQRLAQFLVERLAPLDAASVIVCGDSTPHPKPHLAPFRKPPARWAPTPGCASVWAMMSVMWPLAAQLE